MPYQVIGTGYAGPIYYRTKSKKESKAYILLFSCSLSRAVHLELTPNLTTNEFIKCFKRLIVRRGRPKTVYSDNAKIFQVAAKWLKLVIKNEEFDKFLTKGNTSWNELELVLIDVEVNLNNRPLTYIKDDIQYPILTPNSMLLGRDTVILEEDSEEEDDQNSRKKRQKYIARCKDAVWRRWKREYLTALHEDITWHTRQKW